MNSKRLSEYMVSFLGDCPEAHDRNRFVNSIIEKLEAILKLLRNIDQSPFELDIQRAPQLRKLFYDGLCGLEDYELRDNILVDEEIFVDGDVIELIKGLISQSIIEREDIIYRTEKMVRQKFTGIFFSPNSKFETENDSNSIESRWDRESLVYKSEALREFIGTGVVLFNREIKNEIQLLKSIDKLIQGAGVSNRNGQRVARNIDASTLAVANATEQEYLRRKKEKKEAGPGISLRKLDMLTALDEYAWAFDSKSKSIIDSLIISTPEEINKYFSYYWQHTSGRPTFSERLSLLGHLADPPQSTPAYGTSTSGRC